jgi:hypothetical protein
MLLFMWDLDWRMTLVLLMHMIGKVEEDNDVISGGRLLGLYLSRCVLCRLSD